MSDAPCPIFVINLDRSAARLENVTRQFRAAGLDFERIPGVDGRELPDAELARLCPDNSRHFYAPLGRGEIGCYLSHLRVLRIAQERRIGRFVVFEDDFELEPGFADCLRELCMPGMDLPDAVKLHGRRARGQTMSRLPSGRCLMRSSSPPICSVCTLWTIEGSRKMTLRGNSLLRPIDVQTKHWWEMGLDVLWVAPPPVLDSSALTAASTIGSRKVHGPRARLRQMSYRVRYAVEREAQYARTHGLMAWMQSMMPAQPTGRRTP